MANVKITDFVEQSTLDAGDFLHVKKEGLPDRKISKENLISQALTDVILNGVLDFADDTDAATGGVPLNGVYRTGSLLKIRVV